MNGQLAVLFVVLCSGFATAQYYGNYYCQSGRDVVVHLFEWKWTDIEKECSWLAQNNYCAVQVRQQTLCVRLVRPISGKLITSRQRIVTNVTFV
jgi:alpha-amylase